jgi:hypothetical protein
MAARNPKAPPKPLSSEIAEKVGWGLTGRSVIFCSLEAPSMPFSTVGPVGVVLAVERRLNAGYWLKISRQQATHETVLA